MPTSLSTRAGGAAAGEDHGGVVVAVHRVVDDPAGVLAQPGGLQAGAAALGVGVGVARQHLVADEVLEERQRSAARRVVGVRHPPRAERAAHQLVVADHRLADAASAAPAPAGAVPGVGRRTRRWRALAWTSWSERTARSGSAQGPAPARRRFRGRRTTFRAGARVRGGRRTGRAGGPSVRSRACRRQLGERGAGVGRRAAASGSRPSTSPPPDEQALQQPSPAVRPGRRPVARSRRAEGRSAARRPRPRRRAGGGRRYDRRGPACRRSAWRPAAAVHRPAVWRATSL